MKDNIINILRDVVKINSFSATINEHKVVEYLKEYMSKIEYFKDNPELFGSYSIDNDYLERKISYGLVRGNTKKTLVLMNHHDVVGIEDYGSVKDYAFDIDMLPEKLEKIKISKNAKDDLDSGEWIFGRGTADMKGGLAIHLDYLEEYSKERDKKGNILFISVPDEESYSAGMRGAVRLLNELKNKYNLEYTFMIDSEPNDKEKDEHIVSIGTAGKCMPVVLVQGEKAHISKCFEGLNPIGILSNIFLETELSLEFSDEIEGEVTVPPTWNYFKDMKFEYDVSLPIRASGYFSVISFHTTPNEIINKLKTISMDAFQNYVDNMKNIYKDYKKIYKYASKKEIELEAKVMTYEELFNIAKEKDIDNFNKFYKNLYLKIEEKIRKNELNYPEATIKIMDKVLDYSQINYPVVIIGFAPPYYPAVASNNIDKWKNKTTEYFDFIKNYCKTNYNYNLTYENYTVGLSDCSYCAVDKPFDFKSFSLNTPMWGKSYFIDFESIKNLNIPFMIYGPWGKDLHQLTERVNKKSLTETTPKVIRELSKYIFNN